MSNEYVRPALQITGAVLGSFIPGVGTAIGAAIGGAIGGALGAAIAPANVGEGPRLNELKLNGSSYGRPIPLIFGNQNRFAGTVIWFSGLKEERDTREVSKGNEVTEYTYSVDLAIALCEGPVANVAKIWANGKILWQGGYFSQEVADATTAETLADNNATALEAEAATCGLESDPACATLYARATAARAQADAATARKNAAIAAQTDYGTTYTPWSFTSDLAPGATFRFYPGNFTQSADSTIEAAKGTDNAPAYRGICYIVIEDLQLSDFGNRIPNLEFEILSGVTTVKDTLATIHNKSGMVAYDYSTNLTVDEGLDGYAVTEQMSSLQAISQLEQVYMFDTTEQYGQIRHVKRGRMNQATLWPGDLGAGQDRDSPGQPITTERINDEALPKVATITYRDQARDYQPNTQRAQRNRGSSDNIIDVQFGITMTNEKARAVVDRLLWEPWTSRLAVKVTAGAKFGFLTPSDVVGIPVAGAVIPFRIDRLNQGANGLVEIDAKQDDAYIYQGIVDFVPSTSAGAGLDDIGSSAPTLQRADTIGYCFNAPILAADESSTGFSFSIGSDGDDWRGGALFRAADGVSFSSVASVSSRNITGTVASALGDAAAGYWDTVNTITVVLDFDQHSLNTATEAEVLAGANGVWLGAADGSRGEVLQFQTATLVPGSLRTYDLTNLLRGRRATEHETDQHVADEVFVLLEPAYLRSLDFTAADLSLERYYKGVTRSQVEANVIPVQEFTNTGEKARPRSPVFGAGSRDGSNNLTITWQRRIRGYSSALGTSPQPLDEVSESYEIDVYDGPTVVRTLTATSETVSYTAAQQTTDGLTPGDPVTIKIYQISGTVGRGHSGDFTV